MLDFDQYSMAHTDTPLPITYRRLEVDAQEQYAVIGYYLGNHEMCRSRIPMDAWESLVSSGIFDQPRQVGLVGIEEEGGVNGLVVLISYDDVDDESEDEPWLESVSRYEEENVESEGLVPASMVVIGRAFRPINEREYPEDLHKEIMSMLAKLICGDQAQVLTPEQKAIEELLASIE